MRILILGGTLFLGRHLTEECLKRGYHVTLFHRGKHPAPSEWPVEIIHGDRREGLSPLSGQKWDHVIDTSGYLPDDILRAAAFLKGQTDHYTFISSISVYEDFSKTHLTEEAQLLRLDNPEETDINAHYGALKAACETVVRERFPHSLIVRPGLIAGPFDSSDRFTYWPVKLFTREKVLAPGKPDQPVQFIDARDLSCWILDNAVVHTCGTYNLTGPREPMTMREMLLRLEKMPEITGKAVFAPEAFLKKMKVNPWTDLPLWISEEMGIPGHNTVHIGKALDKGLETRSLDETAGDILEWYQNNGYPGLAWGLSEKREKEVIDLWERQ